MLLVSCNVLANLEFPCQGVAHFGNESPELSVHFRCFPVVITFSFHENVNRREENSHDVDPLSASAIL